MSQSRGRKDGSDPQDAGAYTTKLPKAEHMVVEWQAAMEALILVATSGGPDDVRTHRHDVSGALAEAPTAANAAKISYKPLI